MSSYTRVATKLKSQSALVKALVACGFKREHIEVLEKKEALRGYRGDSRKQMASIRIKGSGWGHGQNRVGSSSNDLGFERLEDGTYAFHVSDFDKGNYGKKWQTKLLQNYGREVIREVCEDQSFYIESETEVEGELFIELSTQF